MVDMNMVFTGLAVIQLKELFHSGRLGTFFSKAGTCYKGEDRNTFKNEFALFVAENFNNNNDDIVIGERILKRMDYTLEWFKLESVK